jgi:hypothetical protein
MKMFRKMISRNRLRLVCHAKAIDLSATEKILRVFMMDVQHEFTAKSLVWKEFLKKVVGGSPFTVDSSPLTALPEIYTLKTI